MNSYADQLRPVLPYVPSRLVSARWKGEILSRTRHLPAALAAGPFMVECGLDGGRAADFSVGVLAAGGGPAALAGTTPPTGPAGDRAAWRRIARFARSWADPSSVLGRAVGQVWLEFDVGLTRSGAGSAPGVFFDLGPDGPDAAQGRSDRVRVARQGLALLDAGRISGRTLSTLAACTGAMPPGDRLLFVGAMLSRDTGAVRVVCAGPAPERTLRRLRRAAPGGSTAPPAAVADLRAAADEVWLAVDVEGDAVLPRVGVDCYCAGRPGGAPWAALLDLLVARGACTAGARDALLAVDGTPAPEFDGAAGGEGLRRLSTLLGPAGLDLVHLSLHHVKVIAAPGSPLAGKAYLCGSYRPLATPATVPAGGRAPAP